MTINEIIQQNEELQIQYSKALNTIAALERKVARLQRENEELKRENEKLRRQRNILLRGMQIALQISSKEKQDLHLKMIIERIRRETGEFKGESNGRSG
jgi:cell division protein FtsB